MIGDGQNTRYQDASPEEQEVPEAFLPYHNSFQATAKLRCKRE